MTCKGGTYPKSGTVVGRVSVELKEGNQSYWCVVSSGRHCILGSLPETVGV